jgi:hypothetical protein
MAILFTRLWLHFLLFLTPQRILQILLLRVVLGTVNIFLYRDYNLCVYVDFIDFIYYTKLQIVTPPRLKLLN